MAYRHTTFWQCMDTYKDTLNLNAMWQANRAGWKVWDEIAV
jgi:glucose-1-phosphate cytidylyltransferase